MAGRSGSFVNQGRARAVRAAAAAIVALLVVGGADAAGRGARNAHAAEEVGQPILVVSRAGGLVVARNLLGGPPEAYLASDGRLILAAPRIAIFPPPALANLRQRQLTPTAVWRLRALANDAGLGRRPRDYGRPRVADAPTTEIVYRAVSGRTFVHRAYALGATDGLTPEQEHARDRLQRFLAAVATPAASLGGNEVGPGRPFAASAFEIAASKSLDRSSPSRPRMKRWPLTAVPLALSRTCTPVTGPDADILRRALKDATTLTLWRDSGAGQYLVDNRAVLPGETACR